MSGREIETLSSRTLHRTRWIGIREDQVRFVDGRAGTFTTIDKPDYAVIIPVQADGRIVMVERYRYAVSRRSLELPMGASEDADIADPCEVARKELREETGYSAAEMEPIGAFTSAGGYMRQSGHVFIARNLTAGARELEPAELGLTVESFPVAAVIEMIKSGRIDNVATIAAIGMARLQDRL